MFNVIIPFSLYSDIIPCVTYYKRKQDQRSYNVLKPYAWSDVINDAFISQHHLHCNFIYKRAKVTGDNINSNHFFTFQAKCKDCNSNLFGWCDKKPINQEPINLKIVTNDTRGKNYIHKSKRPLMGSKRMKISKDIPSN